MGLTIHVRGKYAFIIFPEYSIIFPNFQPHNHSPSLSLSLSNKIWLCPLTYFVSSSSFLFYLIFRSTFLYKFCRSSIVFYSSQFFLQRLDSKMTMNIIEKTSLACQMSCISFLQFDLNFLLKEKLLLISIFMYYKLVSILIF